MKIEIYAVCFNEEKILSYFLRHYSQYGKIIIYDNYSTDNSVKIAEAGGAEIRLFDTRGQFDDMTNLQIKENCWKGSKADWCIVIDLDEFVYHPSLLELLGYTNVTVIEPIYFDMFSDKFPTTQGQIYEEVKCGHEAWPKMNLLKPSEITAMNYIPGCHLAKPEGNVNLWKTNEIKTLHMKHLGREYTVARSVNSGMRMSAKNRELKLGTHLLRTPEQVGEDFDRLIQIVIPRI
jgi:glycosyltransferase involved in cell wall biosynthesis